MKRHTLEKGTGFYGIDDKLGYDGIDITVSAIFTSPLCFRRVCVSVCLCVCVSVSLGYNF